MDKIASISEDVFKILELNREVEMSKGNDFSFALRRSNMWNKLDKGYWFYGNKNYIALSFWSGMDWVCRTPNIFFSISSDEKTSLSITCRDSLKKIEIIKELFVEKLNLKPNGIDSWSKEYDFIHYKTSLDHFLINDKKLIDNIISEKRDFIYSEDYSNSIGFINHKDFERWYSNIKKYQKKRESEEYINLESHTEKITSYKLPYSLASLKVVNFGPINNTSIWKLSKNAQIIFLVGDNGGGKTTILRSLALALGNRYYEENKFSEYGNWKINLKMNENGELNSYEFKNNKKNKDINIPFVAYGPSRLITNIEGISLSEYSNKKSPIYSIFNPDAILNDFNRVILSSASNPTRSWMSMDDFKLKWENIKQMIIDNVPNLHDIRIVEKSDQLLYVEQDNDGKPFSSGVKFNQTSSGVRSLIAMLGDMLIRLFDFHPKINDPAELSGLVLIDEVDIHIHPEWQMKIPTLLTNYFPKIQFIVTTHSPIPLLGAPKKSIFLKLTRDIKKGIVVERLKDVEKNISNLLPNIIYTSNVFGMNKITSVINKKKEDVLTQDSYSEALEYKRLKEKLKVNPIDDKDYIIKLKKKFRN